MTPTTTVGATTAPAASMSTAPAAVVAPWWWSAREFAEIRAHIDNPANGLDGIDPTRFGVALSLLPINHPLLVAAGLAVDTARTRHHARTNHHEISHDLSTALDWRRIAATHLPYPVLAARRTAAPDRHHEELRTA